MYCKDCQNFFQVKRKFYELFKRDKYYFCSNCLNKYKLKIKEEVIPLDSSFKLIVYHLYEFMKSELVDYFVKEYMVILKYFIKNKIDFILVDIFSLNDINNYNYLALLQEKDIILVSFL